jgi:hypothetical protein
MTIDHWEKLSTLFVNIALLLGALAAVMKFQLYNMLGHRWRSDLSCRHVALPDGSIIFTADYVLTNTGERPLHLTKVHLRLFAARTEGVLLCPDRSRLLAERVCLPTNEDLKGLFHLEAGERSIYTLRCRLPELDAATFVICGFELPQRRVPAAFSGFYVRAAGSQTAESRPYDDPGSCLGDGEHLTALDPVDGPS